MLYNTTLTDMETGYKAFRTDVLQGLDLREDGFSIEPEITGRICRQHLRIYELPISYYGRTYAEGKKITWRDGIAALFHIVRAHSSGALQPRLADATRPQVSGIQQPMTST